jgi:transposase
MQRILRNNPKNAGRVSEARRLFQPSTSNPGRRVAVPALVGLFACGGNTAESNTTGETNACLATVVGSDCFACVQASCGPELSGYESACSDYLSCVCPGGNFSCSAATSACNPNAGGSSCAIAENSYGACGLQHCKTACSSGGAPCCPETHWGRFSHDLARTRSLEDVAAGGQSVRDPMLPAALQFLIAMVAHAPNERMARRIAYLLEEVRVLREALVTATGKTRIHFTSEQRRRLAIKGNALTAEERRVCCQIVRPETILTWFRQLAARPYDSSEARKVGRPRKATDIRTLVIELARDNPGWGYTKIRDALRGLKVEIGRTTVADMLAQAGIEPAPERSRKRTWGQFLKSHWETLYACDFFSVEVLSVFGTVR